MVRVCLKAVLMVVWGDSINGCESVCNDGIDGGIGVLERQHQGVCKDMVVNSDGGVCKIPPSSSALQKGSGDN